MQPRISRIVYATTNKSLTYEILRIYNSIIYKAIVGLAWQFLAFNNETHALETVIVKTRLATIKLMPQTHLLINCGCDIEALGSSGTTALHKAAKKNRANAVIILLDRGIDPKYLRSERIHSSISFATMS